MSQEVAKLETGLIMGSQTVTRPEVEMAQIWIPWALGLMVLVLIYVLWNYILVKPTKLSMIEAEFLWARKKHKNAMVNVEELPEVNGGMTIIQLSSLDGLFTTADDLLKPVLHKEDTLKHTYCVVDGSTRYEYVSEV